MPDIEDVNGNPAIETDEPLPLQAANEWAIEARGKANPRKAAIERLKCAAAQRRERKPTNPLQTLKLDPSYKVRDYNAEADAFNVESSDGKKLLGKSISNGNVKSGQKVRSFFAPNGQVVIDVKPKGRDIVIPKPVAAPLAEDPEVWPCTVAFLYSRIKPNTENLTDNGATDITSYDYYENLYLGNQNIAGFSAIGFAQRFDDLGDYETADKALANDYKENRKLKPGSIAGSGGGADDAAWASGSVDAVIVWFYIGNPADALTNGKIFKVSGPPTHPSAGGITNHGPGLVMEVNRGGVSSAIFPNEIIGAGPLTKKVKESFPDLGGKIGYAGRIEKWRGVQDYTTNAIVFYFRSTPSNNETPQTPVSYPPGYVIGSTNPWQTVGFEWFRFGWPDPQYIGCASTAWINVETSAISSADCGASVPNDQWYWGGDASPSAARIDKDNPNGYIGSDGIFVCWQGHKDNIGMAQSFFEAFRVYWGIQGSVTKLGSANPYGCGIDVPGGGTSYPPMPPGPPRFIIQSFGRKAEIWLKVCRQNDPPLEIKLPFEFAAIVEQLKIIGAATHLPNGSNIQNVLFTYGGFNYRTQLLENPHATLSIDKEFAYINISYGVERIFEEPLSKPIPLFITDFNSENIPFSRIVGDKGRFYAIGQYKFLSEQSTPDIAPRIDKDCFSYCQSYKVKLPSDTDKTLAIVESQRYKRGEEIILTAKSPDTEFDSKFLIVDFKTDRPENIPRPSGVSEAEIARWQNSSPEYASFGGLPALIQFNFFSTYRSDSEKNTIIPLMPKFYKPQSSWTPIDKIHYQLQESPRLFSVFTEILPSGVYVAEPDSTFPDVVFDSDGKFGRGGRAERISRPSSFGHINGFASPSYTNVNTTEHRFPLFVSFNEQLLGNGLSENNILTKWFRVSASSFPLIGQAKRNLS